jgi:hypothetical protein
VRIVLAVLLALALTFVIVVSDRPVALLLAVLVALLAFLVGSAKLAVDLIELIPSELAADAIAVVALGVALVGFRSGSRLLMAALLALALATQVAPLLLRRARLRDA